MDSTIVDWDKILKDRVRKLDGAGGLFDKGIYDAVMNTRAKGNQTGGKLAGVTLNPGTARPGGAHSTIISNQSAAQAQTGGARVGDDVRVTASPPTAGGAGSTLAASATAAATAANAPQVPGAGSGGGWQWGQPVEGLPFDYQSGDAQWWLDKIPQANRDNVVSDPDMMRRLYTEQIGGDDTTAAMMGNYMDPETMRYLYGMGPGGVDEQFKFFDAFGDFAFSRGGPSIDPREMVGKMISSGQNRSGVGGTGGAQQDPLATQLGADGDASAQVQNFIQMLDQSVQYLMNDRAYAAYKATINKEAQRFLDWRMMEGATSSVSFAQWLNDRLGPNGGL